MGQGRENARVFLRENKDIREKLENALRKKIGIPAPNGSSGAHGPNGATEGDKSAMHAAAAAAGAAKTGKPAGTR
jgi:RecA C-terminal domain